MREHVNAGQATKDTLIRRWGKILCVSDKNG
jgi:hypothetical protein